VDLASLVGVKVASLVAVDWASLVGVYYMISWKNNRKVKYPMLVIVMVMMVMVVVEMTIEKRGLMECMQYEKCASFCNSILYTVTPA
jgi:inner membrane protein involved in colicin E2 resistance